MKPIVTLTCIVSIMLLALSSCTDPDEKAEDTKKVTQSTTTEHLSGTYYPIYYETASGEHIFNGEPVGGYDALTKTVMNWLDKLSLDDKTVYCTLYAAEYGYRKYTPYIAGWNEWRTYYVPFVYDYTYDETNMVKNDPFACEVSYKTKLSNIKATRRIGFTPNPNDYIRKGESWKTEFENLDFSDPNFLTRTYTHEDLEGDWIVDHSYDNPGGGGGSGDNPGSSNTPAGDHTGDYNYYVFVKTATSYHESGKDVKSDNLYVYKHQSSNIYRVSWSSPNSYGFITKGATHEISMGSDPWGFGCNRKFSVYGIVYYFKL